MGVRVDESGAYHLAGGVDLTIAGLIDHADSGDPSVFDGDVGLPSRRSGAVDDLSAAND